MKRITLPVLLFACHLLFGQTNPVVSFKTPEVSAFNQTIETPVSYYTGVPGISIPLGEISIKGVVIPITLDYHAGGIRVDQDATWVGLGWSLNYGGQITRKKRGIADEKGNFLTTHSIDTFLNFPSYTEDYLLSLRSSWVYDAKNGERDLMPDEFHYSLLGYSGKFMYDQANSKYLLFPKEDVQVIKNGTSYGTTWQLKLPDGITAAFPYTVRDGDGGSNNDIGSWLISNIRNIYGDSIAFNYHPFGYSQYKLPYQKVAYGVGEGNGTLNSNLSYLEFTDKRIEKIYTSSGSIEFDTTARLDMPTKALKEIIVKDINGQIIKRVTFYYGYFTGDAFNALSSGVVSDDHKFKRLRLDSLRLSGVDTTVKSVYKFTYYTETQMPSKYSFAQDHWGYFNGISNASMIPNLEPDLFSQGADRRVKPDKAQVFSLKSITYPTGGSKQFIYESNTAKDYNIPDELRLQYQDDHFLEKEASITIVGPERTTYYPSPDSVGGIGERFFKKRFNIPEGAFPHLGFGWHTTTNFGTTATDISLALDCNACNAKFTLYKIEDDSSKTFLREHEVVNCSTASPYLRQGTMDKSWAVVPGRYEMLIRIQYNTGSSTNSNQFHSTNFKIKWREMDSTKRMFYVGGLRIKEIKAFSFDTVLASHKKYSYTHPSSSYYGTSGQVLSFPHYRSYVLQRIYPIQSPGVYHGKEYYAASRIPLETTMGSHAGYEYVTEEIVGAAPEDNLKTEYKFSFLPPLYSEYYKDRHLGIYEPKEWSRGKLLNKKVFRESTVVQEESYEYYSRSPHITGEDTDEEYVAEINTDLISMIALPVKPFTQTDYIDLISSGPVFSTYGWHYYLDDISINVSDVAQLLPLTLANETLELLSQLASYEVRLPYFKRYTGFDKLKKKTTIINGDNAVSAEVEQNHFYQKTPTHYQLTKIESFDSKGQTDSVAFKYAADLASSPVVDSLLSRRMLNTVLEQKSYKGSTLLATQKNNYALWQSNAFAALSTTQSAQYADPLITNMTIDEYDIHGNLKQLTGKDEIKKSYIWDYNNDYPIAEVAGATASNIAATSFEADGKGNWTYSGSATIHPSAPTGKKGYSLAGGNITKSGLSSGTTYVITYWKRDSSSTVTVNSGSGTDVMTKNGWKLIRHEITGTTSMTISGTAYIDELRLYPSGTFMNTYTYAPLIGMTAQCDVNNRIAYYDYDGLGRLITLRDHDKNVVKKFCYNYAGQRENCITYYSVQKSGNFTRNNCSMGYTGSSVTYTVSANAYNSTVSQAYADSLAQAQVDANGQAYANANGTCTYVCSIGNCNTLGYKCINNVCEPGMKIYTASVFNWDTGFYDCTYHYEFSDSSWSQDYVEQSGGDCPVW